MSIAVPFTTHRGYGSSSKQLHKDLQQKWYSKYTGNDQVTSYSEKQALSKVLEIPSDSTAVYSCVGPNTEDFPGENEWLNFTQLWRVNEPVIKEVNGGEDYRGDLKTAILGVASANKVDTRLILSIVMQEVGVFKHEPLFAC